MIISIVIGTAVAFVLWKFRWVILNAALKPLNIEFDDD